MILPMLELHYTYNVFLKEITMFKKKFTNHISQ